MTRGTDSIHTITIQDADEKIIDMSKCTDIHVTYSQDDGNEIDKTGNEIEQTEDGKIIVKLSQMETMLFMRGNVKVQARFRDEDGRVRATGTMILRIDDIILRRPI